MLPVWGQRATTAVDSSRLLRVPQTTGTLSLPRISFHRETTSPSRWARVFASWEGLGPSAKHHRSNATGPSSGVTDALEFLPWPWEKHAAVAPPGDLGPHRGHGNPFQTPCCQQTTRKSPVRTLRVTTAVSESSLPGQSRRVGGKGNAAIPATPKPKTDGSGFAPGGAEKRGDTPEGVTPLGGG